DMDPQNVRRVEEWIASRWPGVSLVKEADGSRLTWALGPRGNGGIESVVATESFLSLPSAEVDRHLIEAQVVCEARPEGTSGDRLQATVGVRTVGRKKTERPGRAPRPDGEPEPPACTNARAFTSSPSA